VNSVVFKIRELVMQLRIASIMLVLGSGVWHTQALVAAPAEPQSETQAISAEGAKYEHRLEMSRFDVGDDARREVEGPYERVIGERGAFLTDRVTGATLAVRSAPKISKSAVAREAINNNSPRAAVHPQPFTENADEHSAVVRAYLVAAGVPASEVSGTHVTTTMAGGGPVHRGVQPTQSKLLWYTTHLERSLGGIPVEGSYAFAALDSAGDVITEGVYWPAISRNVVYRAQALEEKLASANAHAAFLAGVRGAQPDIGDAVGTVKIVHTSAGHHGTFEARAVYSVVMPSAGGGKARILRFDDTGARVRMADEVPSGIFQ
jgi:hypothetical protein